MAGAGVTPAAQTEPGAACTLETDWLRYSIGTDGRNLRFTDKQTGKEWAAPGDHRFAAVRKSGKNFPASSVGLAEGRLAVAFGDSGVRAVFRPVSHKRHLVLEVVSVEGEGIEELAFGDVPLALRGTPDEPFAACALALNLQTNVAALPCPQSRLRAVCVPRFGLAGAKMAICAAPPGMLREALQEAVSAAPELPHSPLGGPWAMGPAINQGSYLFNFDGVSEKNVDDWIALARSLGMTQIDFHGGSSFRFGDCVPNPVVYPKGRASLKAAIDRLHAAGIAAGLHTYAFFIAKNCTWVTPVPDPRLASQAVFTLAADLGPEATAVPVVESTAEVSTITGFFVRNSVTLRIDEELITFTGASKTAPYQFTGCVRGACGTKPARHAKGAKAHHLKECFGLFVPDPHTSLFLEVAARTAETFNECGFDMIYFDALDGEDILGGAENAWHYGSRFVYEVWKRLTRPALIEMSTFHHHLWCVRSRHCAWDHPNRSHKKFVDLHVASNDETRRMFLPGELGWWALKSWSGPQGEPTFPDDIEYLMAKCLGTDTGFALMGIDPTTAKTVAALPRLAGIIKRYEDLRHAKKVPEAIKARLRRPGEEFTLEGSLETGWRFRPVDYAKHKVESAEQWSSVWKTTNRFGRQPLRVRIEALMAAGPYDAPGNPTVAEFQAETEFASRAAQQGVTIALAPSRAQVKAGTTSGCLAAQSERPSPTGAWARVEKRFAPPLDLSARQALGLWVYGDGLGEVLNLQLRSPHHLSGGIGDHYIVIDFTGWRYFELIEPEGARHAELAWPYGDIYSIYRESVQFGQIETLGLWYNRLPPGKKVACYLSPIKALALAPLRLTNPAITVGGQTIVFPAEIDSGSYLEFLGPGDCKLYGPQGQLVREVKPEGPIPMLDPGENRVEFRATTAGSSPRAHVTVITQGEPVA
jgi:hypothetical protein